MSEGITVSDHALVRWLERTGSIDFDPVRRALVKSIERATGTADAIGGGRYLILADGFVYVMRDRTLVTVIPEDGRHGHVARFLSRSLQDDRESDA